MKPLTSIASVEAAKPVPGRQVEYPDSKVRGLALRVTDAGGKSWTLRYRNADGRQRRLNIGRYPAVGLSTARGVALEALGSVAKGGDPAGLKRASKAAARARQVVTIENLLESYLSDAEIGAHRPGARPKRSGSMRLDRFYAHRYVIPKLGKLAIEELTRHQVQKLVDEFAASAPSTARQCRSIIHQAFNYAIRREITKANPAQFVVVSRNPTRERVLTDAELKALWNGAEQLAAGERNALGLAIQLGMLTLQRGGEVTGIHLREIDRERKLWTIPGHRTKNHRTHVVPLSDAALAILDDAFNRAKSVKSAKSSGYAFPVRRTGSAKATADAGRVSKVLKVITSALGIADARPHDFRRTGATNLTGERIGIPRFIVSRVLNQISDSGGGAVVTGVYDRNEYLAQKRHALDAWAALLHRIVSGEDQAAANILPFSIGGSGR